MGGPEGGTRLSFSPRVALPLHGRRECGNSRMVALPHCVLPPWGRRRVPGDAFLGEDKLGVGGCQPATTPLIVDLPAMLLEVMCQSPHPALQGTRPPPFWCGLPSGAGPASVPLQCALPSRRSSRLSEPCVWKSHRMGPGLLQAGGPWRIPDPPPPSTPPAPLSLKSEPSHAYRAELLTQKPVWGKGGGFWLSFGGGIVQQAPSQPP